MSASTFALALVACSKENKAPVPSGHPGSPSTDATTVSTVVASPTVSGNAASGMPSRKELLPLAKPGAACAPCSFNGRCALLTTGTAQQPCCDYANGKTADRWGEGSGHAAECLALVAGAPFAPAPATGSLQPLAKAGVACRECFYNGRCALLVDWKDGLPCCDYAHGKTAGAWNDDEDAARCLALELGAR